MADQTNNLQLVEDVDPFLSRNVSSADNIIVDSSFRFNADVVMAANLTVSGTMTAVDSTQSVYADNNLYLNNGYTTVAGQSGGLTVNYLPTATTDAVAAGGFTAGVGAATNPTVVTAGTAVFSASDLIQISGATDPANNGLFEVLSHVGTTLTIRGIGTTAVVESFTQNQFVTDTSVAGAITKVNVSVLRAGTDGAWEAGSGSATGISFSDLALGTGNDLQAAYEIGNTITTDSGDGSVVIAGTEKLQVTATGGLDVDTAFDFDGTSFDVQMGGSNGFSIDGTAASNVTTTGASLTLSTVTSGDVIASAAGDVDVDGTNIDLLASSAFSIDGSAASNVSVAGANLTLSTTTSGDVVASAAGDVDIDGTNIDLLASSGFSIDGSAASNVTTTGANLTLSTVTSGDVVINPAGDIDGDATNIDLLASSAFSIDGGAASNVSVTAANLTLSTVTSGGLLLASAGDSTYTVPNASATALTLTDGSDVIFVADTTAGKEQLDVQAMLDISGGAGVEVETDAALALGSVVTVNASGHVELADADHATFRLTLANGISRGVLSIGEDAHLFTVPGSLVPVLFGSAPAASQNGKPIYLSATAGQATLTPPTGSGTTRFVIGYLVGADGADTTPDVLYQPQYISRRA